MFTLSVVYWLPRTRKSWGKIQKPGRTPTLWTLHRCKLQSTPPFGYPFWRKKPFENEKVPICIWWYAVWIWMERRRECTNWCLCTLTKLWDKATGQTHEISWKLRLMTLSFTLYGRSLLYNSSTFGGSKNLALRLYPEQLGTNDHTMYIDNLIKLNTFIFVCNMSKCSKCGTDSLHLCAWRYKNTLDEDIKFATETTRRLPSVHSNRWHSMWGLQNSLEFNICFKWKYRKSAFASIISYIFIKVQPFLCRCH